MTVALHRTNLAILSASARSQWGAMVWMTGVLQYGLVGTVITVSGDYHGSSTHLGLGVGGAERLAAHPGNVWMLIVAAVFLVQATSPQRVASHA